MSEGKVLSFAEKLRQAQARLGVEPASESSASTGPASAPPATPVATGSAAAASQIPEEDIPELGYEISPEELALDDAIKKLSILDAYDKWCGKMKPKVGRSQRESIKISCPDPNHPDLGPSAWINLDKNVYFCSVCNYGGDVWDIAALAYGFPVPAYKSDAVAFRKLREMMGIDLGFSILRGIGGNYVVSPGPGPENPTEAPKAADEPSPVEVPNPAEVHASAEALPSHVDPSVGKLPGAVEMEQREQDYLAYRKAPSIDWRSLIPEETFLHEWMNSTSVDNSPEEFHVWTGLMALSFAAGRRKVLWDLPDVTGNLYVCLVGPSGSGKSRASRHLREILDRVLRWDSTSFTGVKSVKQPGSAEYLVQAFSASEEDPSTPGAVIQHPVSGLIEFPELSTLMGIGNRAGSVMKPQLMDIYDAAFEISSGSLTHGHRSAREPFGQCLSTTQNASLNTLLNKGDDDSGFMNRWVFAQGPLKPPIAIGGARVNLDRPAQLLSAIHVWSSVGSSEIAWSEPAAELWTEFFMNTLYPTKEQAEKNGSSMLNRLDLLMKKLILLFTINSMGKAVPKAAVEQAIKLYPYLLATFGVVSNQLAKTEDSELVEKVLGAIKKLTDANGQGPTRRDIYQTVRRSFKSTRQLEDLLKSLVGMEIIKEVAPARTPGQRGQLGVRYAIAN